MSSKQHAKGRNVVVIGTQWGDEGKGKVVDWLTDHAKAVVRFQGGHNAGHTLIIGGKDSVVPFDSIMYQKKYYSRPKVFIFKEGSSHSMFIENYTLFNIVLNKFLKTSMKKSPKSLKRKLVVSKNRTYKNRTPK